MAKFSLFFVLIVKFSIFGSSNSNVPHVDEELFIEQALDTVNSIRKFHGVAELTEEPILNMVAAQFAEEIKEHAEKGRLNGVGIEDVLKHEYAFKEHKNYGFSVAVLKQKDYDRWRFVIDGGMPARYWYRTEYPLHNFAKGKHYRKEIAHFTQMVWKETQLFGAALALTSARDLIMVYMYNPFGNHAEPNKLFSDFVSDADPASVKYWDNWRDWPHLTKFPKHKQHPIRAFYSIEAQYY